MTRAGRVSIAVVSDWTCTRQPSGRIILLASWVLLVATPTLNIFQLYQTKILYSKKITAAVFHKNWKNFKNYFKKVIF